MRKFWRKRGKDGRRERCRSVLHVYADDILLCHTINSMHDFLSLQSDIDKITAWSCANFLALNSNTSYTTYYRRSPFGASEVFGCTFVLKILQSFTT